MPENVKQELTSEVIELVKAYANQGDFGRGIMAKKHPFVDFNALLADDAVVRQLDLGNAPKVVVQAGNSGIVTGNAGVTWHKIAEIAAYVIFVIAVIGGIVAAVLYADVFGVLGAVVLFVVSLVGALLVLALIMVFLQLAKNTGEMKELLKEQCKNTAS